jgi:hypothetical protein
MSIECGDSCCSTAGGTHVALTRPRSGRFLTHLAGVNGGRSTVFQVNPKKTRIARVGVRNEPQRMVAGFVGVPTVIPTRIAYLTAGADEPIRSASPRPESRSRRRPMAAASVASLPHTVTPSRARVSAV